jgi:hypothetical protein
MLNDVKAGFIGFRRAPPGERFRDPRFDFVRSLLGGSPWL